MYLLKHLSETPSLSSYNVFFLYSSKVIFLHIRETRRVLKTFYYNARYLNVCLNFSYVAISFTGRKIWHFFPGHLIFTRARLTIWQLSIQIITCGVRSKQNAPLFYLSIIFRITRNFTQFFSDKVAICTRKINRY